MEDLPNTTYRCKPLPNIKIAPPPPYATYSCNFPLVRRTARGFTLIEISIILVVVGLLVGGILTGADMIHAAKLKQVVSEVKSISTAATAFQTKYNCLPGDCANATGLGFTGVTNGNGDGMIQSQWNSSAIAAEQQYFWVELNQAGLSNLTMTQPAYKLGGTGPYIAGLNSPASSYGQNSLYVVTYIDQYSVPVGTAYMGWGACCGGNVYTSYPPDNYGNAILMGATTPAVLGNSWPYYALTPADAYWIDSKIDDGWLGTGNVVANLNGFLSSGCSPNAYTPPQIPYNVSYNANVCFLAFKNAF